jgi:uncharacterized protein (TIGR02271 family)
VPYGGDTVTAVGLPEDEAKASQPTNSTDRGGRESGEVMTRPEERLRVGTESVETGRVRLRKRIVTENVTQTVPVSHEEISVEREPITDANMAGATSGPELQEDEAEITLHAERPVTAKETVQ